MQLSRAALFLGLFACATSRPPTQIGVGDTLELALPELGGKTVSLADHQGKVVLVDLWATWCQPCKVSLPFYDSLLEQHGSAGFTVLAISVDAHKDDVERYVEAEKLDFTVLLDPEGTVPQKIGISTMPTMLLLGRDGKIAYVHEGFRDSDRERIAAEIGKALR